LLGAECLFQEVEKFCRVLDRKARRDTVKTFGHVIRFAHDSAPFIFYFLISCSQQCAASSLREQRPLRHRITFASTDTSLPKGPNPAGRLTEAAAPPGAFQTTAASGAPPS